MTDKVFRTERHISTFRRIQPGQEFIWIKNIEIPIGQEPVPVNEKARQVVCRKVTNDMNIDSKLYTYGRYAKIDEVADEDLDSLVLLVCPVDIQSTDIIYSPL